jgi:membrane protein
MGYDWPMRNRLLAPFCRRFGWARTLVAVLDRFSDVHGGYLASAITLAAFLALFPLLLVGIAVLGFVAHGRADPAKAVIDQLSLSGSTAQTVRDTVQHARGTATAASVIGLAGLLWSGLGLVASVQFAFDSVWQVTGRGLKDKAVGLAWLLGAVVILGASVAATAVAGLVPFGAYASLVVTLPFDVGFCLFTFRVLNQRHVGWKPLLPGAVAGGIGLEVLKLVGAVYVPRLVAHSSALYGPLGSVFALLAWLLFFGRLIVYSSVLNVVRWEEDHGTVTVEMQAPRVPGEVPVEANRAGETSPRPAPAAV